MATGAATTTQGLRALRRELEDGILALATSIDGRRFTFQAALNGLAFQPGGYVALQTPRGVALGQVWAVDVHERDAGDVALALADEGGASVRAGLKLRYAGGHGVLTEPGGGAFHDAPMRVADADELAAWVERDIEARATTFRVGALATAPAFACRIDARGFDRHTFLCGQSGSGKTYSLGVLLERLLLSTDLRIVVLDPNSDFVRLGAVRDDADPLLAVPYGEIADGIVVRDRLRFDELTTAARAAVLRLDPLADLDEYGALAAHLAAGGVPTASALEATGDPQARRLAQRTRNLGVEDLGVWARGDPDTVLSALRDPAVRCLVVDLGALATHVEQALVAGAVLDDLWRRRADREPVLIVIDEAHAVCPAAPEDALSALATEQAVRIAGEGRKFGRYLLISTQRPQKVAENVVSQCDNVVLMRLNSTADTAAVAHRFSYAPSGLVDRAPDFGLGEALVAGKLSPTPALVRFDARLTVEGGGDVAVTWAHRA